MRPMTRRTFLSTSASTGLFCWGKPLTIKVGCQANAWPLKAGDFEQLIQTIQTMKSLGYAGFECNIRFVRGQFDKTSEARRKIEATGVQFIGAHTSIQEAEHENFADFARGAAQLSAEYIVMSGPGLSQDGQFTPDAVEKKAKQIEVLARTCTEAGIHLAYHNHTAEFANHNAEANALADHTDPQLVSFLMDAGHGYQGGGDPAAFMLRSSNRIVGCHLKTFRNNTQQVPLGQGDFGFEPLAAAIKKTGWTGWLIDEEGGGKSSNPSAVGPDRKYIRHIFGV
jgi:sugar phosphate isomerase/epimerase